MAIALGERRGVSPTCQHHREDFHWSAAAALSAAFVSATATKNESGGGRAPALQIDTSQRRHRSVHRTHEKPKTMTEPFISITGMGKCFGDRHVLEGVNLSVAAGETVALIGPSGGGKSTLLRCVNGLTRFDSGTVRVGPHQLPPGRANDATARPVRRLIGMIFQDFQLFRHLTALENVMEAPVHVLKLSRAEAARRDRKLLTRVGLGDRSDAYPRQLSGGQQQRVAIARALAMEPRGLLCDEITSALDPELKHEVLKVEDLRSRGLEPARGDARSRLRPPRSRQGRGARGRQNHRRRAAGPGARPTPGARTRQFLSQVLA